MTDEPFLCAPDLLVVPRKARRRGGVSRLPEPRRLEEQRFRRLHGDHVSAEMLDEIEAEIDRRVEAAPAKHVAGFGDEALGFPVHARVEGATLVDDAPMRRCRTLVE